MSRWPVTEEARQDRPPARRNGVDPGYLRRAEDEDLAHGAVLGTIGCSILGCRSTSALGTWYQYDFYGYLRLALCDKHARAPRSEGLVFTFEEIRNDPERRAHAGLPPLGEA